MREPEKFINKALNIAGLYTLRHRQRNIKLTVETKYEILQLKLTQLAVLESIHGSQYMIDYLSEVLCCIMNYSKLILAVVVTRMQQINLRDNLELQINGPIVQVLLILPLMRKRTNTIISMEKMSYNF